MLRTLVILVAAFPLALLAQEAHRHHGPHVHGEATLNVGMDGQLLVIGLEAPGMSLLGFEHPPHNDQQRLQYDQTLDALRHPEQWLTPTPQAACVLDGKEVTPHGFGGTSTNDAAEHHEHADFDASYQFRCQVPLALRSLEVHLIDRFPELHKINVELVLPDRQGSQVLLPGSSTVSLSK